MIFAVDKANGWISRKNKSAMIAIAKKYNLTDRAEKMTSDQLTSLIAYDLFETDTTYYFTSRDVAEDAAYGIRNR